MVLSFKILCQLNFLYVTSYFKRLYGPVKGFLIVVTASQALCVHIEDCATLWWLIVINCMELIKMQNNKNGEITFRGLSLSFT